MNNQHPRTRPQVAALEPVKHPSRWLLLAALVGVVAIGLWATACGDDDDAGISIVELSARAAETGNSAVYFTIKNEGEADRLVSAASTVATEVQLHETTMEGGSAMMRELESGIEIPADEEVTLKPGGLHVMLIDLKEPLEPGSEVTVTLTFEKAGEMVIKAPIVQLPGMSGGMDDSSSDGE